MPISQRSFGITGEGREVILYTLANDDGMSVEVMKAEHCVSVCMHGGNGSVQKQHRSPHKFQ